jgi:hypothetical protein
MTSGLRFGDQKYNEQLGELNFAENLYKIFMRPLAYSIFPSIQETKFAQGIFS